MFDYKNKELNMRRELDFILAKTLSMFRYEGLPDTIPQRDLERQLQTKGYAFVTEVEGELYSFTDGLGGLPDPYGNPTQIVIANPALDYNATLDLKDDGVLINNDSMKNGIKHLLEKYILMMNENEISMVVNSFNSRIPTLISAGDDATRESAEEYLRQVVNGELGVIAENRLFEGINAQATGAGGSMYTQMIEYQQYLKASLYNELGLEVNFNMKRERLTEDEVNMVDIIYPFVDNMMMNRQKAIEEINKKYDLEISIGFDSVWAKYQPNETLDEDAFMDEVDFYLEQMLGPGDLLDTEPQGIESIEELSEEEIEALLVDVSEEELQELVDVLLELEAEEEEDESESTVSDTGSTDSNTDANEEQSEDEEGGGSPEPSRSDRTDDTESGVDNTEPSDESDGESGEPDATTTTTATDGETTTESGNTSDVERDGDSTDGQSTSDESSSESSGTSETIEPSRGRETTITTEISGDDSTISVSTTETGRTDSEVRGTTSEPLSGEPETESRELTTHEETDNRDDVLTEVEVTIEEVEDEAISDDTKGEVEPVEESKTSKEPQQESEEPQQESTEDAGTTTAEVVVTIEEEEEDDES